MDSKTVEDVWQRPHAWIAEYKGRFGRDVFRWLKWGKDRLPKSFEQCYVPTATVLRVFHQMDGTPESIKSGSVLAALTAWRQTPIILSFSNTRVNDKTLETQSTVRFDVLRRLPYWGQYLQGEFGTSPGGGRVVGAFAFLDYDFGTSAKLLRLVLDVVHPDRGNELFAWPVRVNLPLREGVEQQLQATGCTDPNMGLLSERIAVRLAPVVGCVLHLCDESFPTLDNSPFRTIEDISGTYPEREAIAAWNRKVRPGGEWRPPRSRTRRAYRGWGPSPRPHVRRAHFHDYWVGPRYHAHLETRWLAPVVVLSETGEGMSAVVYRLD